MNHAVNFANVTYVSMTDSGNIVFNFVWGGTLTWKKDAFALLTTDQEGDIKGWNIGPHSDANLSALIGAIDEIRG